MRVFFLFVVLIHSRPLFVSVTSPPDRVEAVGQLAVAAMLGRALLSRGVTAHRLAKNVTLYVNESVPPASECRAEVREDHKPVLLMLPWLGSRPQALAKYCDIYFRTGYDVLVVESQVRANNRSRLATFVLIS